MTRFNLRLQEKNIKYDTVRRRRSTLSGSHSPRCKREKHLWIGTADIKDLYVGERPLLGVLADLISKGREIRLTHAKEPGPKFREDFDHYPVLFPDWSGFCAPEYTSN